jgi:hypothetical protein
MNLMLRLLWLAMTCRFKPPIGLELGVAPPALPDAVRLWTEAEERLAATVHHPLSDGPGVGQEVPACSFG